MKSHHLWVTLYIKVMMNKFKRSLTPRTKLGTCKKKTKILMSHAGILCYRALFIENLSSVFFCINDGVNNSNKPGGGGDWIPRLTPPPLFSI